MKSDGPSQPSKVMGRRTRLILGAQLGLAVWLSAFFTVERASELDQTAASVRTNAPFRIGYSSAMFTAVNENDAKAALKVWLQILIKERDVPVDREPQVFNGVEAIARALRNHRIDGIAMPTDEYVALHQEIPFSPFIASIREGRHADQYLLLVHQQSGVEHIHDLKGRSLAFLHSPRMSLAMAWLETLLFQEGLGRPADFFNRVTQTNKLSQVILPVFFQKTDACLVTRTGFETMQELNPQLGRQMKIITTSPALVPDGFHFRADYSPPFKARLLEEIGKMHTTPAGLQVLTIFQCDKLEERPISVLDSAVELIAAHRRLLNATNAASPLKKVPGTNVAEGKAGK